MDYDNTLLVSSDSSFRNSHPTKTIKGEESLYHW